MARLITMDSSGRLVIPRDVRRHLHLHAGARLKLIDSDDRLLLEPLGEEATLLERDGLLIVQSEPTGEWIDHRDLREERLERASGRGLKHQSSPPRPSPH